MICSKQEFLKTFLPDSVKEIDVAQINLDITDLSISDILRNVNKTYPENSRKRNAISSGTMAVGILCKTETLDPMQGIFLLIGGDNLDIQLVSKRYLVIYISEQQIGSDDDILDIIKKITDALVKIFKDDIKNLGDFYRKFIYDPYEEEDKTGDYTSELFDE